MNKNPFKGKSIFDLAEEAGVKLNFEEEKAEDSTNNISEVKEEVEEKVIEVENNETNNIDIINENKEELLDNNIEEESSQDSVESKFVLIIGAFSKIGRAIINASLNRGYLVFALDKIIDDSFNNENVMTIECDITNIDSLNNTYNIINDYTDRIEAIINCNDKFYFDNMVEGEEERLRDIIDVNFFGPYRINKLFIPFLAKGAKIINVNSEFASYSAQPFMGCYSISKKMLDCYNDALRRELNYFGIKVVKIEVGSFRLGLLENVNSEYERMYNNTEVYKFQLAKLKRMMDKELKKEFNSIKFQKLIEKILKKKNPKLCYRIFRSSTFKLLNSMPEAFQDKIYKKVSK